MGENNIDTIIRNISTSWKEFKNEILTIRQFFIDVSNDIYKVVINRNKFYLILAESDWPPPHDLFINSNIKKIDAIVESYEKYGLDSVRKDVDSLMLIWHSENIIDKLYLDWKSKSWLQNRLPVLQDAIWAHKNGYFTLSVPTLIPQIEGLLVEHFRFIGRMNSHKYKNYFESLLHPAVIIKNRNVNLKEFITNTLLTEFVHGSGNIGILSRHAITHGADISYATPTNSLRIILLINAMIKLFTLVAVSGSKTCHLYGCTLIGRSKKERLFFSTIMEANRDGYKICKRCGTKEVQNLFG